MIDSRRGSDSNDGLSRQTAWRTTEAINAHVFQGGDEIRFRAGETYFGHLQPKREHDGGVIRFGVYGVGERPEIAAPMAMASICAILILWNCSVCL